MAKLSLMPPGELAAMARRLADAGIAVTVLPATDLFLMGRDQDHAVRRGVADANLLVEHGVNCSLSTNNVLNPATPYGDCSLIRIANLHANVLQVAAPAALRDLLLHAERALGAAAEPAPITALRRATRPIIVVIDAADPGAGGRRNPPAARRLEARPAHRDPSPARIARPELDSRRQ